MADFTALKTAITNAIKQNGNQAITGNLLQEILIAMVESMGDTALNNLATSIQVSLNSLSAEDGNLSNAISSEASTRQSADNTLSSAINSEALTRYQADTTLQQNINTESNQRQSTDNSLQNQITIEKNARIDAVNRLQGLIDAINNVVGNGYTFGGVVKINDAPQQGKMFYIALERGNYINFGGASVHNGITLIYNNGQWIAKELLDLDVFYGEILRIVNAYQPIVIEGNVTNAPDEEDLTSNNIGLLQFKNKAYAPTIYSGLGRKYLRKNIRPLTDSASFDGFVENVEPEASLSGTPDAIFWDRINERFVGKKDDVYYQDWTDSEDYVPVSSDLVYMNEGTPYRWDGTDLVVYDEIYPDLINMLTQEMISDANTIYHIQYDYILGEDVTIPANCILEFDGGSLSNGTLVGQNTIILNGNFDDIEFGGSFSPYETEVGNIAELKSCKSIVPNSIVKTLGYYNPGDGGGASYHIRIKAVADVETVGDLFELQNGLVAELVIEDGFVNIKQFGCKTDVAFDNADNLQVCLDFAKVKSIYVVVPEGTFKVDKTISLPAGTNMKGEAAYSFKNSTLYTSIQTDFTMFTGVGTDIIRHCIFEGITFARTRTQEERDAISIGSMTGCGYGLAGTCFSSITEGNFIKCGFIGWGACFKGGFYIIFLEGTDFSYCNNVVNNTSSISCFKVSHANGWCLGNIFEQYSGIQDVTIESSWFEFYVSVIKSLSTNRIINFSIVSSTMTNAAYGGPIFDINGNTWNRIFINVINSCITVKTIIGNNINYTSNIICFENSHVVYSDDFNETTEGAFIYGNSRFYDKGSTEHEFNYPKKRGINYNTGNAEVPISLKRIAQLGDVAKGLQSFGDTLVFRDSAERNILSLPPVFYKTDNSFPVDAEGNALSGPYFIYNPQAHSVGDILLRFKNNWGGVQNILRYLMAGDTRPTNMTGSDAGSVFFDTIINRPIWWDNSHTKWVDAEGYPANLKKGTKRPKLSPNDKGYRFYDETLDMPIWWNGYDWRDRDGVVPGTPRSGTFADKPNTAQNDIRPGFAYFCTDKQTTEGSTDGIMIYYKDNNIWVDALGRVVS